MYQGFQQGASADFILVAAISTAKHNVLSVNQVASTALFILKIK
jgi:hypothetical protein